MNADGWLTTSGAVPLEDVVFAATQAVQGGLLELAKHLGGRMTESQRRDAIRSYLGEARGTLERLLMLVRWALGSHAHTSGLSGALAASLERQDAMRRAADDLFHLHRTMPLGVVPQHDVLAAVDILSSGTFSQLPRALRAPVPEEAASRRQASRALRWLRGELRRKRQHWRLPEGVQVAALRGSVRCLVPGEYVLALTAEDGAGAPWRLVRLRLLAGSPSPRSPDHGAATVREWRRLWREAASALETRPAQPLLRLHPPLHAACAQLALARLHAEAVSLARGAAAPPV